ncbi:MAG: bifunctional diaminohydroxyphosphoribosylaminopyrimidine deaminase/5-amino-6-(5-phosphoribosylamino)uracil reductase RibD [Bdellovibrio sp.]
MSLPRPQRGEKLSVEQAMKLAISEAYKGAPFVSPNPLVGATVLDAQGGFLAAGYHEVYGGPHAEVQALRGLSDEELREAHVIVTLEPCAHQGKTPSCARMLATKPLKKVTYGLIDPNPLVAGQGAAILQEAGIEAELFLAAHAAEDEAIAVQLEKVCEAFLWNFREKKIFVALKMASSMDGQVALRSGESQWITGPESREQVHYLRACYDAILVGKGTVEFDNPSLDIRHPQITKKNKVIVLDGEGELLLKFDELKLAKVHDSSAIYWCVSEESREAVEKILSSLRSPPEVLYCKTHVGGDLNLQDLLRQLYGKGLRSVMVEGGALTASSFIQEDLVNRLYLFQAPIIMGAGGSRSWTETVRISVMKDKIQLKHPEYITLGSDIFLSAKMRDKI